ncbi:MAG: alpha-E domain-containing protein, partial [Thiothrix litoralis]
MLSRVAERVYWMARYLERAEKTARLINVHTALLMDLPGRMEINWFTLIRLYNAESLFSKHYDRGNEANIMQFLIADRNNPASLATSLANVRENVRTSLDVLPEEIWEQANQIHSLMTESLPRMADRHKRQLFLRDVMKHCQCIR